MNHLVAPTRRSNIKGTHTVNKFYCRFIVVVVLTYYTKLLVRDITGVSYSMIE
jgi:hypothetical protein